MKVFVFLFLFGCAAAASLYDLHEDALDEAADGSYIYHYDSLFADEHVKIDYEERLREALHKVLEKIKDSFEKGQAIGDDLQHKLKELKDRMKEMRIDFGQKARDLMQQIREKARDFFRELLDKLGKKDDTHVEHSDIAMLDFNLKDLFRKLKKELLKNVDKEALKAKIEQLFGKGSEMADALEELINKKGAEYKQKLLDLIDRFLGKDDKFAEQHGVSDYWQKIKDYFKDLHIDLQEKYMKFGNWVKDVVAKGLDKSKTKLENIKEIANEFMKHSKDVSKDVAVEALEFLRPYKDDLKDLYDHVKDTVKDILKRKD